MFTRNVGGLHTRIQGGVGGRNGGRKVLGKEGATYYSIRVAESAGTESAVRSTRSLLSSPQVGHEPHQCHLGGRTEWRSRVQGVLLAYRIEFALRGAWDGREAER